jgi:hypothetical protein
MEYKQWLDIRLQQISIEMNELSFSLFNFSSVRSCCLIPLVIYVEHLQEGRGLPCLVSVRIICLAS